MPRHVALRRLGRRIAELRGSRGVTQETFAHGLGLSVRTVAGIEAGASTTTDTLVAISAALGVEFEDLFVRRRSRPRRPG